MKDFFSGWRKPSAEPAAPRVAPPGAGMPVQEADRLVAAADVERDAGRPREAAALYAKALALRPNRADLRVQLANMLKDSGDPDGAVDQYRIVITHRPDDADAYLQLGRALRHAGRHLESLEAFRRSRDLDPGLSGAASELLREGALALDDRFHAPSAALARLGELHGATAELLRLRTCIDETLARMPDLEMWSAAPPEGYGVLRRALDIPDAPPQEGADDVLFALFFDADAGRPEALHALIETLLAQPIAGWTLHVAAQRPAIRNVVARAGLRDARVRLGEEPAPDPRAWRLHLPAGRFLHAKALGWLAAAAARHPDRAFFMDEEIGDFDRCGDFAPESVDLRAGADLDALIEADVVGATLLLPPGSGALRLPPQDIEAAAALRLDLAASGLLAHVPMPLSRRLTLERPVSAEDEERRRRATEIWLKARDGSARLAPATPQAACRARLGPMAGRLAVIIPSRDNPADLEAFVASLLARAARPASVRLMLIDHASARPETAQAMARLAERPGTRVTRLDEPFNWARFNNLGAQAAWPEADALLFANDDMLMLSEGWDEIVLDALARPGVGAVGARLVYPDDLIQHAGVVAGWGEAVDNDGRLRPMFAPGPNQRWRVTRAAAAVVGAFLATRAETFAQVGGFDEAQLPIAFSDVDFCLKLRANGLRALYSPHLTVRHHENKTRGHDGGDPDRQARYQSERAVMERRWGEGLRRDPSVHPFWRKVGAPFRLLAPCGAEAALAHLDLCAAAQPWRIEAPRAG